MNSILTGLVRRTATVTLAAWNRGFASLVPKTSTPTSSLLSSSSSSSSPNGVVATSSSSRFSGTMMITRPLTTSTPLRYDWNANRPPGHPEYIPFQTRSLPVTDLEYEEDRFLKRLHDAGPKIRHKKGHPLDYKPQMKGVVLKTLIKHPKKPNSANRKCVLVRLTNGREATAFVPKEGHPLQEHSVVLVMKKRVRDVPGLKLRVIRGAHDCPHPVKVTRN